MAPPSAFILDPRARRLAGLPPLGFEGEPEQGNPDSPLGESLISPPSPPDEGPSLIENAARATHAIARGATPQPANESTPNDTSASGGQADRAVHGTPAAGLAPWVRGEGEAPGLFGMIGRGIRSAYQAVKPIAQGALAMQGIGRFPEAPPEPA